MPRSQLLVAGLVDLSSIFVYISSVPSMTPSAVHKRELYRAFLAYNYLRIRDKTIMYEMKDE